MKPEQKERSTEERKEKHRRTKDVDMMKQMRRVRLQSVPVAVQRLHHPVLIQA